MGATTIAAVVFDLDGVLLDSEQRWNEAKAALVRESGGCWREQAPTVMMGMSSPEWGGVPARRARRFDGRRRDQP